MYSTTNSFVSLSSFLFFLSVCILFHANFISFFSLRLSTFYSFTLHIFCQPQKFSGTIGAVVRHIMQPCSFTSLVSKEVSVTIAWKMRCSFENTALSFASLDVLAIVLYVWLLPPSRSGKKKFLGQQRNMKILLRGIESV